ncbi:serine/threonine-protein kinase [Actinoalloteichus caeruleus]|uniref:serine/threonine-protein kinase n=2 Tax=Actinoalloteichus cyanogriseus TaxID=2893586 RepID=UPI00068BFF1D|nr:serine/threonine-protein kinase [Actinoalloteichus caeruleus]
MDSVIDVGSGFLDWLYGMFGVNLLPGDWVWSAMITGVGMSLLVTAGAAFVALLRKGIGNRYTAPVVLVLVTVGVGTSFLLPYVLATSNVRLVHPASSSFFGLSGTVSEEVFGSDQALWTRALAILVLVLLPLLLLGLVAWQGRLAARRGPAWPGRMFWMPFLLLVLLLGGEPAGVVASLWIGSLPAAVAGVIVVALLGSPPRAVIERSERSRDWDHDRDGARDRRDLDPDDRYAAQALAGREAEEARQIQARQQELDQRERAQQLRQRELDQREREVRLAAMNPQPSQSSQYPATQVDSRAAEGSGTGEQPAPERASGSSELANTPGPLPFPVAGAVAATPGAGDTAQATEVAPALFGAGHGASRSQGRFQRIRQLGKGGFGSVWLAMDTSLNRMVAVKIAHAPDAEGEERMIREARALAAVRHPNCVRIYDIVNDLGDGSDGLALVMEYLEGDALSDVVRENTLDDVAAARLWASMAEALGAAHEKGLLHRDIKPANILVDQAGVAHLIDFGIARSSGDSSLTATGMMVGTPDYIAPEVARGGDATPASDAWQLAATVSYALTANPPRGYRENAMASLMAAAHDPELVHLPEHSVHRQLLLAALDQDPARRPPLPVIVRELGGWLGRAGLSNEGPVTRRITPDDPDRTQVHRPGHTEAGRAPASGQHPPFPPPGGQHQSGNQPPPPQQPPGQQPPGQPPFPGQQQSRPFPPPGHRQPPPTRHQPPPPPPGQQPGRGGTRRMNLDDENWG